ncbi:unnamed protein product [Schistocephalus solidus]|uniref:Tnp_DDE_dom domain-containing protein n=1 Tax=Schistocephalus solidus TaxID=70667 RepID=A0A183SI90_SCHSO|nr:unnamed protein product [Schistocephalus solidus]
MRPVSLLKAKVGTDYAFVWSGHRKAEGREAGVAFAIRANIMGWLTRLAQGINRRFMNLCLPLRRANVDTVVGGYASSMTIPNHLRTSSTRTCTHFC